MVGTQKHKSHRKLQTSGRNAKRHNGWKKLGRNVTAHTKLVEVSGREIKAFVIETRAVRRHTKQGKTVHQNFVMQVQQPNNNVQGEKVCVHRQQTSTHKEPASSTCCCCRIMRVMPKGMLLGESMGERRGSKAALGEWK